MKIVNIKMIQLAHPERKSKVSLIQEGLYQDVKTNATSACLYIRNLILLITSIIVHKLLSM